MKTNVKYLLLCIVACVAFVNAFAFKNTYNVTVGQTFTVYTTYKSYTQAVLWNYDASIVRPVGLVSSISTSVTFQAIAASPSSGSIIQAVTYYYQSGTSSSGMNKCMDDWKVTVTDNSTVTLDKTNIVLHPGGSTSLTATVSGSSYSGGYTWTSSASGVAYPTVNATSRQVNVYARSNGTATITVKLKNGSTAQCTVTVKPEDVSSASISPSNKILKIDEYYYLSLSTTPSNAPVTSEYWVSQNPNIATVSSSGRVTGVSEGTTSVYCVVNGTVTTNQCVITVMKPVLTMDSYVPAVGNATNQSVLTKPAITFCRTIYQGNAYAGIALTSERGDTVVGQLSIQNATLRFTPTSPLTANTRYLFYLPANAVKDKYGTGNNQYVRSFTTGDQLQDNMEAPVVIGDAGYTTYFNADKAYQLPIGLTGYMFNTTEKLVQAFAENEVVPANTPLVLGGEAGTYMLCPTDEAGNLPGIENLLRGSNIAEMTTGGEYYYALSLDSTGINVGFYWMAENGGPFLSAPHKAYLALSELSTESPLRFFAFREENTATATDRVKSEDKTVKFLRNGAFYIRRDGIVYDAMGNIVQGL